MIENIIKTSWSSSGNDEAIKLAASIIITNHGSITAAAASEDSSKEPKTSSPEFTFR
jgi:ABC-type proline/glycine betaine transport system ATPase subunit